MNTGIQNTKTYEYRHRKTGEMEKGARVFLLPAAARRLLFMPCVAAGEMNAVCVRGQNPNRLEGTA
jgi:hypothetical protein